MKISAGKSRLRRLRTFSSWLHAACDVDRVTKQTVPRHGDSNYSTNHWATV